jgi:hypothetical protein
MSAVYLEPVPPSPTTRKRLFTPSRESFLKEDLLDTQTHRDALADSSSSSSSPIARLRPVLSARRPVRTCLWILGALAVWIYLYINSALFFPQYTRPALSLPPGAISIDTIVNLTEQRLLHLQSGFRADQTKAELNVDIPYVSLPKYRDELRGFYDDYFARPHDDKHGTIWDVVEERLSLFPTDGKGKGRIHQESAGNSLKGGLPKAIYATSVKNDLPFFFYSWVRHGLI